MHWHDAMQRLQALSIRQMQRRRNAALIQLEMAKPACTMVAVMMVTATAGSIMMTGCFTMMLLAFLHMLHSRNAASIAAIMDHIIARARYQKEEAQHNG